MTITCRRDDDQHRFLAEDGDEVAGLIDYRLDEQVVVITHTETDPAHQGQGVAGDLTRFALDDIRARGQQVRPVCPYTRSFVQKHPEYQDLLAS